MPEKAQWRIYFLSNMVYFKVDERLDEYIQQGASMSCEICRKQAQMSTEQIWMRDPVLQCKEEFLFYEEVNAFLWISYVLEGCRDMEKAFNNWMERDALFAGQVEKECGELGYLSIKNDGSFSVEELVYEVSAHFGLTG